MVDSESTVGGGSLPGEVLPSVALALTAAAPDALAARLRQAEPPVVGRIRNDRLQLDPRTVLPRQGTSCCLPYSARRRLETTEPHLEASAPHMTVHEPSPLVFLNWRFVDHRQTAARRASARR